MAVGDNQPSSKAAPPRSVGFVDTQRAEALARAFETISHVSGAGSPCGGGGGGRAAPAAPVVPLYS